MLAQRAGNARLKGIFGNDILHVWGDSDARKKPQKSTGDWGYYHYKHLDSSKRQERVKCYRSMAQYIDGFLP